MFSSFKGLLPHGAILICNMYIVFFLIDRVNTAMCFIDNGITKGLLVIMCAISMITSISLMRAQRRADEAKERRAQKKRRAQRLREADAVQHRTLKKAA